MIKRLIHTLVSNLGIQLINLVTGILTARLLAPAGRGEIAALMIWVQTIGWLVSLGYNDAVTYLQANDPEQGPRLLSTGLLVTLGSGVIGVGIAELILPYIFTAQDPGVVQIGRSYMFSIFLVVATEFTRSHLAGDLDTRFLNGVRLALPLLYATGLALLWWRHDFTVVTALTVNNVTCLVCLALSIGRLVKRIGLGKPSWTLFHTGLAYGLRQHIGNVSSHANTRLDLMILPAFIGAAQIGFYSIAGNVASFIVNCLGSLNILVLPAATRRSQEAGLDMVARTLRLVLTGGAAAAAAIYIIAPWLLGFVYGRDFAAAVLPLRVLLPGAVLMAATNIVNTGLQSRNKPLQTSFAQIVGLVVTVLGLGLLLRPLGILGAALTSTLSYAASFVVAIFLLARECRTSVYAILHPGSVAGDLAQAGRTLYSRYRQASPPAPTGTATGGIRPGGFAQSRRKAMPLLATLVLVPVTLVTIKAAQSLPAGCLQLGIIFLIFLPALLLAASDSVYLLVYVLGAWVVGPEVRRLVDWSLGAYQPVTILSLLPLLVTMTLLIPVVRRRTPVPAYLRSPVMLFGAALAYGGVLGILKNGFSSIYDTVNYLGPFLVFVYIISRPVAAEREIWLRSLSALAVVVGIYGWIQYLVAPVWDTLWMTGVAMLTIGKPLPLQIRMFSTLNAPGPAGSFFALALLPMLCNARARGRSGWVGAGVVAAALAITLVRSAWISLVVSVLVYIWTEGSRNRLRNIAIAVLSASFFYVALPFLPGGDQITSRMSTLNNIQGDDSYHDRINFSIGAATRIFTSPLGMGTGSTGVGTKLDNSGNMGEFGYFDNGFLALLFTFGLPGGCLMLAFLYKLASAITKSAIPEGQGYLRRIAIAAFAANIAALFSGNSFPGVTGVLFWLLVALPFSPQRLQEPVQRLISRKELRAQILEPNVS